MMNNRFALSIIDGKESLTAQTEGTNIIEECFPTNLYYLEYNLVMAKMLHFIRNGNISKMQCLVDIVNN